MTLALASLAQSKSGAYQDSCRRRSWLFHDFPTRLTVEKFCTTPSPIETTPQVDRLRTSEGLGMPVWRCSCAMLATGWRFSDASNCKVRTTASTGGNEGKGRGSSEGLYYLPARVQHRQVFPRFNCCALSTATIKQYVAALRATAPVLLLPARRFVARNADTPLPPPVACHPVCREARGVSGTRDQG